MTFGERLRKVRKSRGLSQGELADKAGINRSYLSMVENGHSSPTMDVIERLAAGIGVSAWRLITDVEEGQVIYDQGTEFEMYDALKTLLDDDDEMMLIQPTLEEVEMLKGVRFSGKFQPDVQFYRDALLAYRRRTKAKQGETSAKMGAESSTTVTSSSSEG